MEMYPENILKKTRTAIFNDNKIYPAKILSIQLFDAQAHSCLLRLLKNYPKNFFTKRKQKLSQLFIFSAGELHSSSPAEVEPGLLCGAPPINNKDINISAFL